MSGRIGQRSGHAKAVVAIDKTGKVVKRYRNMFVASEYENCSVETIKYQCQGKAKYPTFGRSYAYEEDAESMEKAKQRSLQWLSTEDFKTIPGYEEYEISKSGTVRRKIDNRIMQQYRSTEYFEYQLVCIRKPHWHSCGNVKVIRLLALTYLGMPQKKTVAYLKDNNKPEFDLDNIAWDYPENLEDKTGRKYYRNVIPCMKISADGTITKIQINT